MKPTVPSESLSLPISRWTLIGEEDGEAAAERVRQGFSMISVTSDISSMITEATRNLRMARG